MAEWHKDESFWIELYPFLFSAERFEAAEEQMEKALRLVDFKGRSVLDLCCGPGRHAVMLAKMGYRVTGVDSTAYLIDKARENGGALDVDVEWVLEDMRTFARPGSFDLVLNFFTSFGYFENREEDHRVLRKIHENLKPGGTCLLEMLGRECLARDFQATMSQALFDGSLLVQRHEVVEDWTRVKNEWILIKNGNARSYAFHLNVYTGRELKEGLGNAGFSGVRLYGNLDGDPYDEAAARLVAVARKE